MQSQSDPILHNLLNDSFFLGIAYYFYCVFFHILFYFVVFDHIFLSCVVYGAFFFVQRCVRKWKEEGRMAIASRLVAIFPSLHLRLAGEVCWWQRWRLWSSHTIHNWNACPRMCSLLLFEIDHFRCCTGLLKVTFKTLPPSLTSCRNHTIPIKWCTWLC